MKPFGNILFFADGSASQARAMARVASLAASNQSDLTVLDVVPAVSAGLLPLPGTADPIQIQSAMVGQRREQLEALVAPHRSGLNVRIEVLVGRAFFEVIRTVLRGRHDLLVKPAENPEVQGRIFGSTDMHLLRKCPCPVWLTGPEEKSDYGRVLAAVDVDPDDGPAMSGHALNRQILEIASSIAIADFAQLHLAHVWDAPGETMVRLYANKPDEAGLLYAEGERRRHQLAFARVDRQLHELIGAEAYDHLAPQSHLRRGAASKVVPELASQLQADLLVMGTVARTGIAGIFIGNTAESILSQIQCSVVAVKPPGFVSPIAAGDD